MTDSDDPRGSPYSSGAPPARVSVIVPPPDVVEAIREAQDGPPESRDIKGAETAEPCLACRGTGYVVHAVNAEYDRLRSASKPPEDPTR